MLLQFLLPALPDDDYAITVATLDAQPNLSVHDKLATLRNREDMLRIARATEDKALAAKQSALLQKSRDGTKCKFCNRGPHDTDDCEFRRMFNEVMEAFTRKQIRRAYKSDRRGYSQRRDQNPKKLVQSNHKKAAQPN